MAVAEITIDLGRQVGSTKDAIDKAVGIVVRKIALDVHSNLIDKPTNGGTPIDTGYARSNWMPRIGAPFEGTVGVRPRVADVGESGFRGASGNRYIGSIDNGAQQQARDAVVSGYRIDLGGITITNNVDYIGRLNFGSSRQAPAGFVERAIRKALVEDIRK